MKKILFLLFIIHYSQFTSFAQEIDPRPFGSNAGHWYGIADKHNMINALPNKPRYKSTEVANIADNILLFQKSNGGWPKNYDIFAILTKEQKDSVEVCKNILNTTFDNGTTYTHVEALAIAYNATKDERYKIGAVKGLEYILAAQYPNGGWPQYYPLQSNYSRYITFNDDAFEGIMELLKDIKDNKPQYSFVDDKLRKQLSAAFEKGIDCVIKTQINDAGVPTAWCQQYDEVTLQPTWARKFEPPSICNKESADLVLLLMKIKNPSQEVINAIEYSVKWFNDSKIFNTRVETVKAEDMTTAYRVSKSDKVVVIDSTAPPIWTRYYELKTHRPMFCNRDSKIVYSLSEVERERRDGYAWYSYDPQKVLDKYAAWKKKLVK